jgi:Xaa-Pro aminopeptidase
MFETKTYIQRRERLKRQIPWGLILFLGNGESPMNYEANIYPFRQDSSFLYFFGIDTPGLAVLIDVEENNETLFGHDPEIDDILWTGPQPSLAEHAAAAGIGRTAPSGDLADTIRTALAKGKRLHYLPPYRPDNLLKIASCTGSEPANAADKASLELIRAVAAQRTVKSGKEVDQIEIALGITRDMHALALKEACPGKTEQEVAGAIEGLTLTRASRPTFPIILTVHGETLHNLHRKNRLEPDRLVICDTGAESPLHYASDVTRTFPVSGRFSPQQKDIYQVVLDAQSAAIGAIGPGVPFLDVHLLAARTIAGGLKALGLMRGDPDEAVAAGAHALFFPHGLGHLLGLDVHDMEDLGEDRVGYSGTIKRSDQFGLSNLRLAKELPPGCVVTVEPGVYFIPQLIDLWQKEAKHAQYIDYDAVDLFRSFGGVRIEDDVLVTSDGNRLLGEQIPVSIADVEEALERAREG